MKSGYWIQVGSGRIAVADLVELLDSVWLITRINVPLGYRGRGYGRSLLEQIVEDAEAEDVTLVLEISSYGSEMDNERLQEWYMRYGFVECEDSSSTLFGYFVRHPNCLAVEQ